MFKYSLCNLICQEIVLRKFIKTECGLNKYEELRIKKGFYNLLRLYWFIFFASIRDSFSNKKSKS